MADYEGFIRTVSERAHASVEHAERAACAPLRTLAERRTAGETEDVAERLPAELRRRLGGADGFDPFHVEEFLRRVEERAGLDRPHAERHARAVFVALRRAVRPDEFDDLRSELPKDFEPLLADAVREPAPPPGTEATVSVDELIGRVAERAGLDRDRARRAVEAVLEALAHWITAGHEGVDGGQAAEHARAVLDVLREVTGDDEFHDTTAQLPGEYRVLLRRG